MLPKILIPTVLIPLLFIACSSVIGYAQTGTTDDQPAQMLTDKVILNFAQNVHAQLIQSITPGTPCTIFSYIPCNYLIPANDYVTFTIPTSINLGGSCLAVNLRTVTITFETAPSVPIFVWLTGTLSGGGTTSTTPVYMTNASQTIYKSSLSTWFTTSATYTTLCVQAIYPSPPPTTFYYPMSCTILYQ